MNYGHTTRQHLNGELIRIEGDCHIVWDAYAQCEARTYLPDACQLARAGRKDSQRFLAEPAAVTAFGDLAPTYRPAVRFAPMMATPGEARAFTQGDRTSVV